MKSVVLRKKGMVSDGRCPEKLEQPIGRTALSDPTVNRSFFRKDKKIRD